MKIEEKNYCAVQLKTGDVFLAKGNVYLATDDHDDEGDLICVSLVDGFRLQT
jgi:hypothetical protein